MRVAIVGFPFSGKTTLFTAISGIPRAHLKPAEENLAAVKVPEPRLELLERLYKPKRLTEATMDFVDLPGSAEGESEHAGLNRHLPALRQAEVLLLVVRAFRSEAVPAHRGRVDPREDLRMLREELLLADLVICDSRIERLEKAAAKSPREGELHKDELALLQRCRDRLQNERPLREVVQRGEEEKMLRSFGFLTLKPTVLVINVGEEQIGRPPLVEDDQASATLSVCAAIEAEILQMDPADRPDFLAGYGIQALGRDRIIRAAFDALGMISFLTGSEEEVRAWALPRGATALEAAGKIHTDLARGFIRAETVAYEDLRAAGSMREAKAGGKVRQEPKGYIVQDGDILLIKFNV
jgi:GTP-binding protein YchF